MHKWRKWVVGPFKPKCIYEWFKQEVYPVHFKQNFNALKNDKLAKAEANKAKNKSKHLSIDIKDIEEKKKKN